MLSNCMPSLRCCENMHRHFCKKFKFAQIRNKAMIYENRKFDGLCLLFNQGTIHLDNIFVWVMDRCFCFQLLSYCLKITSKTCYLLLWKLFVKSAGFILLCYWGFWGAIQWTKAEQLEQFIYKRLLLLFHFPCKVNEWNRSNYF